MTTISLIDKGNEQNEQCETNKETEPNEQVRSFKGCSFVRFGVECVADVWVQQPEPLCFYHLWLSHQPPLTPAQRELEHDLRIALGLETPAPAPSREEAAAIDAMQVHEARERAAALAALRAADKKAEGAAVLDAAFAYLRRHLSLVSGTARSDLIGCLEDEVALAEAWLRDRTPVL